MEAEVRVVPLVVGGRQVATDLLGYLLDPADWTEEVALAVAEREGVRLGTEHWRAIRIVRDWYGLRRTVPEASCLLKGLAAALGEERGNLRYLHKLFPFGYGTQLCKIAGMTMPREHLLDC
jgi:tRNA 2-thiouridine synthesizing protein E